MKQPSLFSKQEKQAALNVLNCQIRSCEKCSLSVTRKHALIGEENIDARILLAAGIERDLVFMTNLIKCILPKNRKPKMSEIELCSQYLDKELSIIQPEVVVPLGYYATRTILQKYHADLSEPHMKITKKAFGKLLFLGGYKIFPLSHPASLLYNPSYEPDTIVKYKTLQTLLHDCKWFPACPIKRFYETSRLDRKWIELYCRGDWKKCVRYEMEELGHYHPDWMLPDGSLDEKLKDYEL